MSLQLSNVFDEYPNPVYIIKPFVEEGRAHDFEYIYVNTAFCLMLGLSPEEMLGRRFTEIFKAKGESHWFEAFVNTAIGKKHAYVDYVSYIINKKMYTELFCVEPDMCCCVVHDFQKITAGMSENEDKTVSRKMNNDCLTGFYNRFYLKEKYDDIQKLENVGITYLDVNNLRLTNEMLGHSAGDELLIRVANTIRELYSDSMTFRIGGDEFVIITTDKTKEEFLQLSEKSQKEFDDENSATIGYRFYDKIKSVERCINECDSLMYEHKQQLKKDY
jgi:diguanylate cyclase (GGDEF)-like protein